MATATQNISIRIAVLDGDKTRRELTLTGDAGQRALAKIKEATAPAGKSLLASFADCKKLAKISRCSGPAFFRKMDMFGAV